eukprot:c27573_g2_i1 orf=319-795(+)
MLLSLLYLRCGRKSSCVFSSADGFKTEGAHDGNGVNHTTDVDAPASKGEPVVDGGGGAADGMRQKEADTKQAKSSAVEVRVRPQLFALKCATCCCHRNFHRREVEGEHCYYCHRLHLDKRSPATCEPLTPALFCLSAPRDDIFSHAQMVKALRSTPLD